VRIIQKMKYNRIKILLIILKLLLRSKRLRKIIDKHNCSGYRKMKDRSFRLSFSRDKNKRELKPNRL
jgi:hypothetical protein